MSNHLVVNANPHDDTARQFEALGLSDAQIADLAAIIEDIGFWRYDLDTGLAYWSEGVFRLHGREVTDGPISLKAAIADFHPDDRELVSKCVSEAIENQCGYAYTLRLMRGDEPVWISVHARYDVQKDGHPILYGCIFPIAAPARSITIGSA